jgi:hypothetical protein
VMHQHGAVGLGDRGDDHIRGWAFRCMPPASIASCKPTAASACRRLSPARRIAGVGNSSAGCDRRDCGPRTGSQAPRSRRSLAHRSWPWSRTCASRRDPAAPAHGPICPAGTAQPQVRPHATRGRGRPRCQDPALPAGQVRTCTAPRGSQPQRLVHRRYLRRRTQLRRSIGQRLVVQVDHRTHPTTSEVISTAALQ